MVGRLQGKVAVVTGAARGQGRAHAVRLANEGADVVAIDICHSLPSLGYELATSDDLEQTACLVGDTGQRVLAREADVRDTDRLDEIIAEALVEFGKIDIACSNAGLVSYAALWEIDRQQWEDVVGTNLTGHWSLMKAVVPSMIAAGGGAIVVIGSAVSTKPISHAAHYVASKHGLVGLMKAAALELASTGVRVNMVNPGGVATAMVDNPMTRKLFCPDIADPTMEDMGRVAAQIHPMGVPFLEPEDVSNAVVYLASDEARHVTGAVLAVDLGMAIN